MSCLGMIVAFAHSLFRDRAALAAENLALRQQLAIQQRSGKRPRLRRRDRIFWVWLSKLWPGWQAALLIVKPDTVVRWHRQGQERRPNRQAFRSCRPSPTTAHPSTFCGTEVRPGATVSRPNTEGMIALGLPFLLPKRPSHSTWSPAFFRCLPGWSFRHPQP